MIWQRYYLIFHTKPLIKIIVPIAFVYRNEMPTTMKLWSITNHKKTRLGNIRIKAISNWDLTETHFESLLRSFYRSWFLYERAFIPIIWSFYCNFLLKKSYYFWKLFITGHNIISSDNTEKKTTAQIVLQIIRICDWQLSTWKSTEHTRLWIRMQCLLTCSIKYFCV